MLPSAIKKQLSSVLHNGFVLKRAVFHKCLELYPILEWETMMNKINALNRFRRKNNDFIRLFTAGVKPIELDASGRILIPKDLMEIAGIRRNIVISSVVNILEIWDKEKYERAILNAVDDFSELAEEVMGNENGDEIS